MFRAGAFVQWVLLRVCLLDSGAHAAQTIDKIRAAAGCSLSPPLCGRSARERARNGAVSGTRPAHDSLSPRMFEQIGQLFAFCTQETIRQEVHSSNLRSFEQGFVNFVRRSDFLPCVWPLSIRLCLLIHAHNDSLAEFPQSNCQKLANECITTLWK